MAKIIAWIYFIIFSLLGLCLIILVLWAAGLKGCIFILLLIIAISIFIFCIDICFPGKKSEKYLKR